MSNEIITLENLAEFKAKNDDKYNSVGENFVIDSGSCTLDTTLLQTTSYLNWERYSNGTMRVRGFLRPASNTALAGTWSSAIVGTNAPLFATNQSMPCRIDFLGYANSIAFSNGNVVLYKRESSIDATNKIIGVDCVIGTTTASEKIVPVYDMERLKWELGIDETVLYEGLTEGNLKTISLSEAASNFEKILVYTFTFTGANENNSGYAIEFRERTVKQHIWDSAHFKYDIEVSELVDPSVSNSNDRRQQRYVRLHLSEDCQTMTIYSYYFAHTASTKTNAGSGGVLKVVGVHRKEYVGA